MQTTYRKERDVLGEIEVPSSALYGAYTARVIRNFGTDSPYIPPIFLRRYIQLKLCYAKVNLSHRKLGRQISEKIIAASDTLLTLSETQLSELIPVRTSQSGGGTSTNMAINEVIANLAEQLMGGRSGEYKFVHPNQHVNMSQSSNDTFPALTKIVTLELNKKLIEQLRVSIKHLEQISRESKEIRKIGRTHLQDALEMSAANEISAFITTVKKSIKDLEHSSNQLRELPIGATAIGSLQNINSKMRVDIIKVASKQFGERFVAPDNYYESTSSSHDLAHLSALLSVIAADLLKICSDIKILSSGPDGGIAEMILPKVQPGSSIMPGKVNPSLVEALEMVCFEVIGNNHAIQLAHSKAHLQLQHFMPLIAFKLYDSLAHLTSALCSFNIGCLRDLKYDKERAAQLLKGSKVFATTYSEKLGYEKVAKAVRKSVEEKIDLYELLDKQRPKN